MEIFSTTTQKEKVAKWNKPLTKFEKAQIIHLYVFGYFVYSYQVHGLFFDRLVYKGIINKHARITEAGTEIAKTLIEEL